MVRFLGLPLESVDDASKPGPELDLVTSPSSLFTSATKSFTVSAVISAADIAACSFRNCNR